MSAPLMPTIQSPAPDHRIYYEDLYNAVLADIQYHAQIAYEDRDKAVALAVKMNDKADGNKGKTNESKLKQTKKRYDEVTRLFDRLYEDSLSGRISNDNFNRLIEKYQSEQEQLLRQMDALQNALQEVKDQSVKRCEMGGFNGGICRHTGTDRRKP